MGGRQRYSISPCDGEKCAGEGRALAMTVTWPSVRSPAGWVSCSERRRIKALGPQQPKRVASSEEVCPGDPHFQPCLEGLGSSPCLNSRAVWAPVAFISALLMSGMKNTDWQCLQSGLFLGCSATPLWILVLSSVRWLTGPCHFTWDTSEACLRHNGGNCPTERTKLFHHFTSGTETRYNFK